MKPTSKSLGFLKLYDILVDTMHHQLKLKKSTKYGFNINKVRNLRKFIQFIQFVKMYTSQVDVSEI